MRPTEWPVSYGSIFNLDRSPSCTADIKRGLIKRLELLGTRAFAVSGVISAMRKNMDVVGIVVGGFLAAFGGGTLRDVLIDRRPFFGSISNWY